MKISTETLKIIRPFLRQHKHEGQAVDGSSKISALNLNNVNNNILSQSGTELDLTVNTDIFDTSSGLDLKTFTNIEYTLSAVQSINNANWTVAQFNTQAHDALSEYNTGTYRFTPDIYDVPYIIIANIGFASNAAGFRACRLSVSGVGSGTKFIQVPAINGTRTIFPFPTKILPTGSQYFQIEVYQNSGGALNLDTVGTNLMICRAFYG